MADEKNCQNYSNGLFSDGKHNSPFFHSSISAVRKHLHRENINKIAFIIIFLPILSNELVNDQILCETDCYKSSKFKDPLGTVHSVHSLVTGHVLGLTDERTHCLKIMTTYSVGGLMDQGQTFPLYVCIQSEVRHILKWSTYQFKYCNAMIEKKQERLTKAIIWFHRSYLTPSFRWNCYFLWGSGAINSKCGNLSFCAR